MNPIRLTHHNNPIPGPWWRYRCICGTTGGNRNLAAAHQKASRHAATCPAIAVAVERDKLARRVQRLQTALDRLTAAAVLPDGPPC